jgi:hypothetical protein
MRKTTEGVDKRKGRGGALSQNGMLQKSKTAQDGRVYGGTEEMSHGEMQRSGYYMVSN